MKCKILSSILVVSSLFMGQAFAEHDDGMEKVKYLGVTSTLMVPKFSVEDVSGTALTVMTAELKLTKADEPYEFELVDLKKFAEEVATGDHSEHDKAVFAIPTSTLTLPEVHIMGADGVMTGLMSAELKLISFVPPLKLQVTSLLPKEMPSMEMPKAGDVDSKGCVYPETWHDAMSHCMDQTG